MQTTPDTLPTAGDALDATAVAPNATPPEPAPHPIAPDVNPPGMDPLPPDIVLTAIVISFAVGALMLVISYRVYRDHGTDDPERLPSGAEP